MLAIQAMIITITVNSQEHVITKTALIIVLMMMMMIVFIKLIAFKTTIIIVQSLKKQMPQSLVQTKVQ